MRGIVLVKSLRDGTLPASLLPLLERRYSHHLGRPEPLEVCRLRLDAAMAPVVAFALAEAVRPSGYYAHLVDEREMYVAFPKCVVVILRDDSETLRRARQVGAIFQVARAHMRFDEMFELDHPDMHSSYEDLGDE